MTTSTIIALICTQLTTKIINCLKSFKLPTANPKSATLKHNATAIQTDLPVRLPDNYFLNTTPTASINNWSHAIMYYHFSWKIRFSSFGPLLVEPKMINSIVTSIRTVKVHSEYETIPAV